MMKHVENELWLDPIPAGLRASAVLALQAGDARGFLYKASNDYGLDLVVHNMDRLKAKGLYEAALLGAYIGVRTNHYHWPLSYLRYLFERADRARLAAAGSPLLGAGCLTLYRGVAGRGRQRRVRGLSWTTSREKAAWFAERAGGFGLKDPATYCTTVEREHIYAYTNERSEEEYIVLLPPGAPVKRMRTQILHTG